MSTRCYGTALQMPTRLCTCLAIPCCMSGKAIQFRQCHMLTARCHNFYCSVLLSPVCAYGSYCSADSMLSASGYKRSRHMGGGLLGLCGLSLSSLVMTAGRSC